MRRRRLALRAAVIRRAGHRCVQIRLPLILTYAGTRYRGPHRRLIGIFVALVVVDASLVVVTPLLIKKIVDDGILKGDSGLVTLLALGIAASTATFSVVGTVLFGDLPYRDADRLVAVWPETNFNNAMVREAVARMPALESASGISGWGLTLVGEGPPLDVRANRVSPNHLDNALSSAANVRRRSAGSTPAPYIAGRCDTVRAQRASA